MNHSDHFQSVLTPGLPKREVIASPVEAIWSKVMRFTERILSLSADNHNNILSRFHEICCLTCRMTNLTIDRQFTLRLVLRVIFRHIV